MSNTEKRGPDGLTDAECDLLAARFAHQFAQQRSEDTVMLRDAVRAIVAKRAVTPSGSIELARIDVHHSLALLSLYVINQLCDESDTKAPQQIHTTEERTA